MQWGAEADAKLFMHVLKIHNVKIDYAALAMAMGNDVTPKALTHRIAKLRSMADDASTSTPGASSGLGLPQPNKRTATKPRASRSMTPGPAAAARKKAAAMEDNNDDDDDEENEIEDVKPVGGGAAGAGGIKRSATGAVKGANGNGKGKGKAMAKKSPLRNVVVAVADGGEDEEEEEEGEEDVKGEMYANKKVKIGGAGMRVGAEADDYGKEYA